MTNVASKADFMFSYAPGKIILVGEHAVIYGSQAIAMPIDVGIRVAFSRMSKKEQAYSGPVLRGVGNLLLEDRYFGSPNFGPRVLHDAIVYLIKIFGDAVREVRLIIDSSLPVGRGLGSSAALSVALVRGFAQFLDFKLDNKQIYSHVMALETIFHGRPSGIDHTTILESVPIGFRKAEHQVDFWSIKIKHDIKFVIGVAEPHVGTKNAVASLARKKERISFFLETIFKALDYLAVESEEAIKLGQLSRLGEIMNCAHGLLNSIGLSTTHVERLCFIARNNGALGAKLTGAGGGGAVIALVDDSGERVLDAFSAAGYQAFSCQVPSTKSSKNITQGQ